MLKHFLTRSILLLVAVIPLFSFALEDVVLQLKWKHQFQFAGYYSALEQGYYEEAGFNVLLQERDPTTSVSENILNGQATFGIADSTIVQQRMVGDPLVLLTTVFQHSPLVFITLESSDLRSPYEFEGKRIMYQGKVDDASLVAMFASLGIDTSSHEIVPFNFNDQALLEDNVDVMSAYITDQPYLYNKLNNPVRIIDPSSYGIDFYGDLLFAHQSYVEQQPERAQAFAEASLKGWKYALRYPDEIISLILKKYSTKKSQDALKFEAQATARMIASDYVQLGTMYKPRFERIANVYKRLGMAPENANVDGLTLEEYAQRPPFIRGPLLRIILISFAILAGFAFFLWWNNKRLKKQVLSRTENLESLNSELERQIYVIDQHVISAQFDVNGVFTAVSRAYCDISGYEPEELIGQHESIIRHPDFMVSDHENMWVELQKNRVWTGEIMNRHKEGDPYWVEVRIATLFDASKVSLVAGYSSTSIDITSKKVLESLSETDPLTDLPNRLKLDRTLLQEWQRFVRYQGDLSILLMDIDHFKSINDSYGHLEGDRVLEEVGKLLKSQLRQTDIAGRWGGEEFLVICPNTDNDSARQVAEKLREAIEHADILKEQSVTASIGISSAFTDLKDKSLLIKMADDALYLAKELGRNKVISSQ